MHHAINEYQLRLDVQRFLWPVYYIGLYILYYTSITTPQDAHKLVLQFVEWLTTSLSGLARHELTTYPLVQALKNK